MTTTLHFAGTCIESFSVQKCWTPSHYELVVVEDTVIEKGKGRRLAQVLVPVCVNSEVLLYKASYTLHFSALTGAYSSDTNKLLKNFVLFLMLAILNAEVNYKLYTTRENSQHTSKMPFTFRTTYPHPELVWILVTSSHQNLNYL